MPKRENDAAHPYQIFTLTLSIFALFLFVFQVFVVKNFEILQILLYIDHLVCLLFFIDFLFQLYAAESRIKYLYTWGWLDLASSIPLVDSLRVARIGRVVRVIRILRAFKATRILVLCIMKKRRQSAFLAVSLLTLIIITFGSIAILQFEDNGASNIKTAEDAVWWSVSTISTVGYGDRYPVTTEGRIVAVCMMCAGVGMFGVFAAISTSWILQPEGRWQEQSIEDLRIEIAALRKLIEQKI